MYRPEFVTTDAKFLAELKRIACIHPERRLGELERLGQRRPIGEMYIATHRERRPEFMRAIRTLPPTETSTR